jgi:glucose/arabinose dehydrogenase
MTVRTGMRGQLRSWPAWTALLLLAGCGGEATLRVEEGTGPNPELPPPADEGYVPVVNIAQAVGWRAGERPVVASGMRVSAFADQLDHPRWLYVLPNGDVLVAETNAP